jgi:hypothetical protein
MNLTQKLFFLLGITVFVVMGIFPPWTPKSETGDMLSKLTEQDYFKPNAQVTSIRSGPMLSKHNFYNYHFILCRPRMPKTKDGYEMPLLIKIDIVKLSVQWLMVAAITSGLVVLFDPKPKEQTRPDY